MPLAQSPERDAPTRLRFDTDLLLRGIVADPSAPRQDLFSPLTHTTLTHIPQGSVSDVADAAHRVRLAQESWAKTPLRTRLTLASKLHDLVLTRRDEILDVIQSETGKSRRSAFDEVADVAMTANYYHSHARRHLGPHRRRGAIPGLTSTWERRVPRGVIGMITPWNYPFTLPLSDSLPAILAGNGVLLKADPKTPLSALMARELLVQAGMPEDLMLIVTGDPAEIGSAVIAHADMVMFTGSTATGRTVAAQCAQRLIDYSAELGGKNPMIVLADAPVGRAIEGVISAAFANAGQLCMSIERLYVHRDIYSSFCQALADRVKSLRLGVSTDFRADVGSLISQSQLDKVLGHINDAVSKGARVLAGGHHRPDIGPWVVEPTLLEAVTQEMVLCREETFGPVVAITPFDTDEEVIALANDTDFGLNASVWGRPGHARRVAEALQAGSVNINEGFTASWASIDAPMGGMKQSGVGRRHGREGITKYTETQTVARQRLANVDAPKGMSQETFVGLMTAGLRVLRRLP